MAEQFEQAEQQVGRGRSRGKDRGKTSWRRAENTTPKELQAKRKRTAKTMPAAKKLRVASEKYEAKAKEKERKELYANFTFLERRITQIYMYISHIHTHTDTHFFSFYFFFSVARPTQGQKNGARTTTTTTCEVWSRWGKNDNFEVKSGPERSLESGKREGGSFTRRLGIQSAFELKNWLVCQFVGGFPGRSGD